MARLSTYDRKVRIFNHFTSGVTSLVGIAGKGKTFTGVAICYEVRELFGMKVISTTHLKPDFGPYEFFDVNDFVKSLKFASQKFKAKDLQEDDEASLVVMKSALKLLQDNKGGKVIDFEDSIIFFDEAYQFMDSRNSNSKMNKLFTDFVSMIRHYRSAAVVTSPTADMLDKRVRNQIVRTGTARKDFKNPKNPRIRAVINDMPTMRKLRLNMPVSKYGNMYDHEERVPIRSTTLDIARSQI